MIYGMEMLLQDELRCVDIAVQDVAIIVKVAATAETTFLLGTALTQCFMLKAAYIGVC